MKRVDLGVKSLVNSMALLFFGLIAHQLACGSFIPKFQFIVMSVSIVGAVTLLSTKATTFRQVVFLSIATQAASHFLLGMGTMSMSMTMPMPADSKMDMSMPMSMPTNMNSWTMLAAHSIGAILSMIYLWHCEKFWSFAGFLLISFRPLAYIPQNLSSFPTLKIWNYRELGFKTRLHTFLTSATSRISAPPVLV
jgi:hypothetical protein